MIVNFDEGSGSSRDHRTRSQDGNKVSIHGESHKHAASSDYIKSMIYGGLDGVTSVFVSVAAVASGAIGVGVVLILGLAAASAGSISMGVGDWLSSDAEVTRAKSEKKRELWEVDNFIDGEIEEMVQIYISKGLSEPTARRMFAIISKYREVFVEMMLVDELGIMPGSENDKPWKHGLVNFSSFILFGCVPLFGYVIFVASRSDVSNSVSFGVSIVLTAVIMFTIGILKGKLTVVKWREVFKSGITTVMYGSIPAVAGGLSSYLLNLAYGVESEIAG